jgi:hypothetical protein
MESLDRPYGDDETDYVTVDPEEHAEAAEQPESVHTIDGDDHATDPAFKAVEEAGGGVSEGFEMAEGELVDNIEGAPPADRTLDGFDLDSPDTDVDEDVADDVAKTIDDHDHGDAIAEPRDEEAGSAGATYGEADEVEVSEVVRDPDAGDDR